MYFSYLSGYSTGNPDFDTYITDLQIINTGTGYALISVNLSADGGLVSYTIGPDGSLTLRDSEVTGFDGLDGVGPHLMLANDGKLFLSGTAPGTVSAYTISASGDFSAPTNLTGIPAGRPLLPVLATTDDILALASPKAPGVAFYTVTGTTLSNRVFVDDRNNSYLANPTAMAATTIDGTDLFIVGSQFENGISVIRADGTNARTTASAGTDTGIPIGAVNAISTAIVEDKTYVIVGSAPLSGGGATLSVFELSANGSLVETDRMLNSLETRFGNVQAVETHEINGRVFVAAAGGDSGLTVFGLSETGQLIHLQTIVDTVDMGLNGIESLTFHEDAGQLYLYAGSVNETVISAFKLDQQALGLTLYGTADSDQLAGGAQSDWLFGGGGNDTLNGGAGDDIIADGTGVDVMTGGAGADTFVLTADDQEDTITDFDPTQDVLNLSGWANFRNAGQLTITSTASGFRVSHLNEVLFITPAAGVTLDAELIAGAVETYSNRITWEVPALNLTGTSGNDNLVGSYGPDTLNGGDGDDIFNPDDGSDLVIGGNGSDTVILNVDYDSLELISIAGDRITLTTPDGIDIFESIEFFQFNDRTVAAADLQTPPINGSPFADTLDGTPGKDIIYGFEDDDILNGFDLSDTIYGGPNNDQLFGGRHGDFIYGDDGDDLSYGNGGNDYIAGGAGDDMLRGGSRRDTLMGEAGQDTLLGNNFADILDGGTGNDILKGGAGDDTLTGGVGDDFLKGGDGADMFIFNTGDGMDRFKDFTPGTDVLDISDDLMAGLNLATQAAITNRGVMLTFSATDSILFLDMVTTDGLVDSII